MLVIALQVACLALLTPGTARAEDPGWEGGFIGVGPDGVYEIDRHTYEITQISDVGIGTRYGTGGAAGWDFEHPGCVLASYFGGGTVQDCLYSIDCTTGAVNEIGSPWWDPTDPRRDPDYGPVFRDIAYDVTTDTAWGYSHLKGLLTIDLTTMTYRTVRSWEGDLISLEYVPGRGLYGFLDGDADETVRIDPATGAWTWLDKHGMPSSDSGDLAYDRSTKTLLAATEGELWRIDVDTGAGTLISSGGPHITGLAMPAHTPEPATCILLACSGLVVAIGRRRRKTE